MSLMKNVKRFFTNAVLLALLGAAVWLLIMQWRSNQLTNRLSGLQSKNQEYTEQSFKRLSDSLSARSQTTVVNRPTTLQRIFGGAKEYRALMDSIPAVIRRELEQFEGVESVQRINRTTIVIEGDTVAYKNEDGVVTRYGRVVPVGPDSSILMIIPQEIEITSVAAQQKGREGATVYVQAINRTTGDTLSVSRAVEIQLAERNEVMFGLDPWLNIGATTTQNAEVDLGVSLISIRGRRHNWHFLEPHMRAGYDWESGAVEVEGKINLLRIMFNRGRALN